MFRQYLAIKDEYPDAILFYRMGDFYEMFFEDAELASRVLDITLTSRNKNDEQPVPMCGFPHRAASGYIARLIESGHKVAVCDQVEDPAVAKGLVRREVVRVITPGMIIDEEFLDARANNFIVALVEDGGVTGLAYLDISTGTFRVTESPEPDAVLDEARRVAPREILLPQSARGGALEGRIDRLFGEVARTHVDDKFFEQRRGYERLTGQFQTLTLEGFGCEHLKAGVGAAGALIAYVAETQKQKTAHITRLETYSLDNFLVVDEISRQNLELTRNIRTGARRGTLLGVLDRTRTAMGARLLQDWLRNPLRERAPIEERLDAVAEVKEKNGVRTELRELLKPVSDLERIGSKIVMGQANARDLTALKVTLTQLPSVWGLLEGLDAALLQPTEKLEPLSALAGLIERAIREDAPPTITEGGLIKAGFDAQLDELVRIGSDAKGYLAQLEVREKERTGINALKVSYNRVFGYYIEVPKSRAEGVPAHYVRKQTLVNAERYITDELKTFETRVLGADEERSALEQRLFEEVRLEAARHHPAIQAVARFVARLDCLLTLAEVADQNDYCRPQIREDGVIRVEDGRHPVVEKMIVGERFVPNAIGLDDVAEQVLIITGPNMAGKSTVLRQVALTVIMAQMGGFVAGAPGRGHARRPDLHPRRRARQPLPGAEHLHGRDAGDRQHPEQRQRAQPGHSGRDRPGHEHLRRSEHRLGRGRVPARLPAAGRQDALCHALPRAHRAGRAQAPGEELQHRGQGVERRDHLPAQAGPGRHQPQLRHPGGAPGRGPAGSDLPRKKNPLPHRKHGRAPFGPDRRRRRRRPGAGPARPLPRGARQADRPPA